MKSLIIVESPTKAKTISSFLGSDFLLESSFGHVRDLPKSTLGVDLENNYAPHYLVPTKAKKTITKLKGLMKKADRVILATDEDREGEAIAWHLANVLGIKEDAIERIVFHEITKTAINEALTHPRKLDVNLVDAQQARRILDRLVGYKLSPFLWKKVKYGLSAGRVQSVAVRLICEREVEIRNFKPEFYWLIDGEFDFKGEKVLAELDSYQGNKLDKLAIKSEAEAKKILASFKSKTAEVIDLKKKRINRNPDAPFTTSSLQISANNRLGYTSKKTMMLAQGLYEKGFITYMRTDSVNLSKAALGACAKYLTDTLGKEYAAEAPKVYTTKSKGAQEAHEAIRPTDVFKEPDKLGLGEQENKLYRLIWQRFVASQMPKAVFDSKTVFLKLDEGVFKANGSTLVFDGYLKVLSKKFEERLLPEFGLKDELKVLSLKDEGHETLPPPRYNEASLVKVLEEKGIGRPSTYASIISVIQKRDYVEKQARNFIPTKIGELVNQVLVDHFPEVVDISFTATMEEDLDLIAEGKKSWEKIIGAFYKPFEKNLAEKEKSVEHYKVEKPPAIETDQVCEKCGAKMLIRTGRFGQFLACSGFPKCKNAKNIAIENASGEKLKCEKCGEGEIVKRFTKKGKRPFWGCSAYPKCDFATWTDPNAPKKEDADKGTEKDDEVEKE